MTLRQMAQFGHPTATLAAQPATEFDEPWGHAFAAPASYQIVPDASAASYFLALPLASLDEMATRRKLEEIGQSEGASAKAGASE